MDPVAHVKDLKAFVGQELAGLSSKAPNVKEMLGRTDAGVTGPFVQELAAAGYNI